MPRPQATSGSASLADPQVRQVRLNWLQYLRDAWSRASRASRAVLMYTLVAALSQITATVVILALYWAVPCDRPLQIYLVAHLAHVVLATPLSAVRYLWRMSSMPPDGAMYVYMEPMWARHLATALELYSTGVFLLGNYIIFPSSTCRATNPPVYILSATLLALSYAVLLLPFIVCILVIFCLPVVLVGMRGTRWERNVTRFARGDHLWPGQGLDGVEQEVLERLERVRFREAGTASDAGASKSGADDQRAVAKKPPGFFRRLLAGTSSSSSTAHAANAPSAVSSHPSLPIPDLYLDDAGDRHCSICLDPYTNNDMLRRLPCTHVFHEACVDTWLRLNGSCPLCKRRVDAVKEAC